MTRSGSIRAQRGLSLIEMMTAITIGLLVLVGLTTVFVNSSNANREMKNTAEQIENGRYAIEFLTQDIRHAGYYGELTTLPAVPGTAPDPCTPPSAGAVSDTSNFALSLPLQRIDTSVSMPSNCASFLTSANRQPNSDIIVVRRADTVDLGVTSTVTGTVAGNTVYIQTTPDAAEIQFGTAGTINSTQNATGSATGATMVRRDFTVDATGTPPQFPVIAAKIRKYRTHVYFVAPCSVPAGGGSICTGPNDDSGNPIPTLKRLEFDPSVTPTGSFKIVPIVEGIEAIRFEYGIDTVPGTADSGTGLIGDGVPDNDPFSNTPSLADMSNTVAMRIYVLARNTSKTSGYVDDKKYTLGTYTTTATNDSYKRHAYASETRVGNQAGRREIPK